MTNTDVDSAACPPTTAGANPAPTHAGGPPQAVELVSAILQCVVAHSEQADLPAKWQFLEKTDTMRQLCLGPMELAAELQQAFAVDELLAARILVRRHDELLLSPIFTTKFFVHFDRAERPVNVHGTCGALSHAGPAALPWGSARDESNPPNQSKLLLLSETLDDLQVFRALGFEAVSSVGFESLQRAHVRPLFRTNETNDQFFKYKLIIADWNVAECADERRPRAGRLVQRLADVQQVYRKDPARRFTIWRPAASVLNQIRIAASFEDAEIIRKLLTNNLPKPVLGRNWQYPIGSKRLTFAAARARLQRAIAESANVPQVADVSVALSRYRYVFNKLTVERLYKNVDVANSPLDILSSLAGAEFAECWFRGQALILAAEAILAGNHPGTYLTTDADRLRIATQLQKFLRNALPRK